MITRGYFRGAMAGMLIATGIAVAGWTMPACIAAETATSATVLVIQGAIADGKPATFDLAALKALPVTRVTTTTPWTEGENLYEGVRLRDVLEQLGVQDKAVIANAVDGYESTIPAGDIRDYDVIIAYAMNGKPLPLEDKGPLWIVYPYSENSRLQTDVYFSRSVWELNRLTVK